MLKKFYILILSATSLFLAQCNDQQTKQTIVTTHDINDPAPATQDTPPVITKNVETKYHAMPMRDSGLAKFKAMNDNQRHIILTLNRIDADHVTKKDTLIVPDNLQTDLMAYSPYPHELPFLKEVKKILFFSYPLEAFAAYENGQLVRWGATNMGRKKDPTPTGFFNTNWKAEQTTSTFNDEWDLKWNFNIQNKAGVGFHQYAMPGYPASHSCLRLMEDDAKYLFNWADQWVLASKEHVLAKGTPVVVFGNYPFGSRKPWLALLNDPHTLDIKEADLEALVSPHLPQILADQQKRGSIDNKK